MKKADGTVHGDIAGWLLAFVLLLGFVSVALYETGTRVTLPWGSAIFTAAVLVGFFGARPSRYAVLCRYILLLYSLPFIHVNEYLFHDVSYFAQQQFVWGLTRNDYELDLRIIERMTLAGAIGALGLVAGMLLVAAWRRSAPVSHDSGRRLQSLSFVTIAVAAVVLSWLNAPRETVFTAAYTQSESPLAGTNFNAAYLVSYVFAAALIIDTLLEPRRHTRARKLLVTLMVLLSIIVWFQFLRGDRECLGLIAASVALFFTVTRARKLSIGQRTRRLLWASAVLVAAVFVGQFVGSARSVLVGQDVSAALQRTRVQMTYGTWSAVAMTPLSVVGDFDRGLMKMRYGRTYIDYLLSVPPGFIAAAFGYDRPIEGTHGPAWEMRYGLGGTHVMVVPFMNFRTPGVFVVLFLYGILVAHAERAARRMTPRALLWYGMFFITGPFWIWYGEMSLIRGIMSFYVVWVIYRLLPKRDTRRHMTSFEPQPQPEAAA